MQIVHVSSVLTPLGLSEPRLHALIPDEKNYTALLLQPEGDIQADTTGVRHADTTLANAQFGAFLKDAVATTADLVVTPEYSMPWETLCQALATGDQPAQGSFWALGCESIRYDELAALKAKLAPYGVLLYENLQQDQERFLDPLAYIFWSEKTDGSNGQQLVILLQFKTYPMGDDAHFEINGLQRGTRIYEFGGNATSLRFVSIICSDAFAFVDAHAVAIYDRALVLHIQLNPKPRQTQYRLYRDKLLQFTGDATELICLNWAKDVNERCANTSRCWNNISGSAWYLRSEKLDVTDAALSANHQVGLYYTWCDDLHSHVLFFNYDAASYLVTGTKVAHIAVSASISRRRGPTLSKRRTWDRIHSVWVDQNSASDGFSAVVTECGPASHSIASIAAQNPISAERVLALTVGKVGASDKWHTVKQIDSCGIDKSEVIYRMTYCQDAKPEAYDFRVARLRRCARLWNILRVHTNLPPSLSDLQAGYRFDWQETTPHQNILSSSQQWATAIYMGDDVNVSQVNITAKRVAEFLQRSFASPDASDNARQRLAVWYGDDQGNVKLHDPTRYLKYNDPRSSSEFDFGRAE